MRSRPLLLALGIAVLLRALLLADAAQAPFWNAPKVDEVDYLRLAEAIATGQSPPHGAYYVAPGYAYVLAGFLKLGVRDILWVKVFQVVVGVGNAMLLFLLTRRFFGAAAGVVAAALWSMVPSVLMHEVLLLKPTLTVSLVLLALWFLCRENIRRGHWVGFGVAMGGAALFRGEMLGVGLALLAVVFWRNRPPWSHAAFGLLGLVLMVAIPTLQNAARGGGFVIIAYGGGTNFYIGNHAGADGSYRPLRPDRSDAGFEERDAVQIARNAAGRSFDASGVSRFWWGRGFAWWRADPGGAVALTLKKAALVFARWEGADVISTRIASRYIRLLANPVVVPGVLFPIAGVGVFLTRRRRELRALRWFVLLSALALIPFFVFERFRLPLLAACIPFASLALVQVVRSWSTHRTEVLLGIVVSCIAMGLLSLPQVRRDEEILRVNIGGMLLNQGRYEEALEEFMAVRRATPEAKRVEINIANAYNMLGRPDDALRSLALALEYLYAEGRGTGRPSVEEIVYCHELSGDIERQRGRRDQARVHYEAALKIAPGHRRVQEKLLTLGARTP